MRSVKWSIGAAAAIAAVFTAGTFGILRSDHPTRTNAVISGKAPAPKHKVLFDFSIDGVDRWDGIMRNIDNLQKELGAENVEIEVVLYGKAWPLGIKVEKGGSAEYHPRVEAAIKNGVRFVLCENTMRRNKLTKDDLMPFMPTVPSAVGELVRKQTDGWAYLKPGP